MCRIGILGGTFNPIHNGHIALAKAALSELNLDKVLIMPTGISYLKANQQVESKIIRSDMVKLAVDKESGLEYSDIEIKRDGNTYTYETLLELKNINNECTYYYIIGADTLFNIENWKNPDINFKECVIAVMRRDDVDILEIEHKINELEEKYFANCTIIDVPKIDISSTLIRDLIKTGDIEKTKPLLPEKVYSYITENGLYR